MKKIAAIVAIVVAAFATTNITGAVVIPTPMLNAGTPVDAISETQEIADAPNDIVDDITDFAATLLGRKYVWGAVGPKTFDCSGFTSYVFRKNGIELPRTSRMQYAQGQSVKRNEIKAGDLMFFSSPRSGKGRVGHVGIVVSVDSDTGNLTFIHASTKKGIVYQKFPDGGYYSRNYIGTKRVIADSNPIA